MAHKRGAKIILVCSELSEEREFTLEHAESLLLYQEQRKINDWKLPENSPYTFTDGELIRSSDKGTVRSSGEQNTNSSGKKAAPTTPAP